MGSQAREVVAEDFYPRPPRGGRLPDGKGTTAGTVFLSTPSARRATLRVSAVFALVLVISIHALREEGDLAAPSAPVSAMAFLSTPSARRATEWCIGLRLVKGISIHALREEGDREYLWWLRRLQDISIHALREEGDHGLRCAVASNCGISIHALREEGDQCRSVHSPLWQNISIHALREEGDPSHSGRKSQSSKFLSTPSARRATAKTEKNISTFVSL